MLGKKLRGKISSYGVERTVNNFHLASIVAQVLVLEFSTLQSSPSGPFIPGPSPNSHQEQVARRTGHSTGTPLEGMMRHT